MEITRRSKLLDVLKAHPFLEEQIIDVAPPFKNLRNPVLRRTVGQLATIEKVAQIGNLDVAELVDRLRGAAGQGEDPVDTRCGFAVPPMTQNDTDWISGDPQFTINGTELLIEGEVPLERVNQCLKDLTPDGFILLVTDFEPSPIVDAMQQQRRRVYHKVDPAGAGQHFTYIRLRSDPAA
jgi:hypothetical protein